MSRERAPGVVAGRALRAVGGFLILASAALPNLHDDAQAAISPIAFVSQNPRRLWAALLTYGLPYAFAAFAVLSAAWSTPRTPRRMGMLAVTFALLAASGAALGGVLTIFDPSHRSMGLLLALVGIVGIVRVVLGVRSGDLPAASRAAISTGAAVTVSWFIILYVDEHLGGALAGIAGAFLILAGTSLDPPRPDDASALPDAN